MAVLDNLGFLSWLHQDGHLSCEGVAMQQNQEKYIIYVRKSTDVEDKQVLSIAAQIAELKEFAARMGIYIVDVIIEKKMAKKPNRS